MIERIPQQKIVELIEETVTTDQQFMERPSPQDLQDPFKLLRWYEGTYTLQDIYDEAIRLIGKGCNARALSNLYRAFLFEKLAVAVNATHQLELSDGKTTALSTESTEELILGLTALQLKYNPHNRRAHAILEGSNHSKFAPDSLTVNLTRMSVDRLVEATFSHDSGYYHHKETMLKIARRDYPEMFSKVQTIFYLLIDPRSANKERARLSHLMVNIPLETFDAFSLQVAREYQPSSDQPPLLQLRPDLEVTLSEYQRGRTRTFPAGPILTPALD